MPTDNLLLEIGCEELPATQINALGEQLRDKLAAELVGAQLEHGQAKVLASPRRIAITIESLSTEQAAREIERRGPNYDTAFDQNGVPTLACIGFARSCGVDVDQLQIKETPKGKWIYCHKHEPGNATADLLPSLVNEAIKKLSLKKPMRWGGNDLAFIRPVHWALLMLGRHTINCNLLGVDTHQQTYGHRYHHPEAIRIDDVNTYEQVLEQQGHVMPSFEKRKAKIRQDIEAVAHQNNHEAIIDEDLLDEVANIVEWPVVLMGNFNKAFLSVPPEALITSMKEHQKCFPVLDESGNLSHHFIVVSNIQSKDIQQVVKGNNKVLNARLADAAFFYQNDRKHKLETKVKALEHVVFQAKLSNMAEKTQRISVLAGFIAGKLKADTKIAKRAGVLAKCDLLTEMIFEFPELQGLMGYYYALHDGEPDAVATAIKEHYYPRFSGDQLPESPESCALALADRLDSLVGIIGIDQLPTGEKDPYALRRAAIGVIRIFIEKSIDLPLTPLLEKARDHYSKKLPNKKSVKQAEHFILERLKAWYYEQGYSKGLFAAVSASGPATLHDFNLRMQALKAFSETPASQSLAAANKRVANILKKQAKKSKDLKVDSKLFEEEAEKDLHKAIKNVTKSVKTFIKDADYASALAELSALEPIVDGFFENVMILCDDKKTQKNRIALITSLHELFCKIADIALL